MSKISSVILGFAAGCVAAYFLCNETLSKKYRKIADSEVNSVKEAFDGLKKEPSIDNSRPDATESEKDEYKERAQKYGNNTTNEDTELPIVVPPEDFGKEQEYDILSFTRFADGTITGDNDMPLSGNEIDDYVGIENLDHFGEFEENVLYIRNDRYHCYYEIVASSKTYSEFLRANPHLKG